MLAPKRETKERRGRSEMSSSHGDGGFRNRYLLAGVRGDWTAFPGRGSVSAGVDVLHTLEDQWGVPAPWGACDSGVDLESLGDDVLRAWAHVDLRIGDDQRPVDVPVVGLLRTMWDSLELFGRVTLTGVDVIAPLDCVDERLGSRVAMSPVRSKGRASDESPRVHAQAVTPWTDQATH
jgi:hypothetical protein